MRATASPAPERRRLWPGPDQVALRSLVPAGVLVALVAADAAGSRPSAWVEVAVAVLAILAALRPESIAGIAALVGSAYVWALVPQPLSPLVLLAAAGMMLTHVGALVAAQGPALVRVDPHQAWLWLRRGVGLWLAAASVWGLAVLVEDRPGGRTTYAVGLVLLAVLAVVGTRAVSRRG